MKFRRVNLLLLETIALSVRVPLQCELPVRLVDVLPRHLKARYVNIYIQMYFKHIIILYVILFYSDMISVPPL